MIYKNREEAGIVLADVVMDQEYNDPIVFGLARGGVVVAAEVAKTINAPLEVLVVRKLGLPIYPELGFGAIAPGGVLAIDNTLVDTLGLDHEQIESIKVKELKELNRRLKRYGAEGKFDLKGQTVIIVDDGIATGVTMIAAIRFIKKFLPMNIVVAAPVCAPEKFLTVKNESVSMLCLDLPELFVGVGEFYEEFEQISDEEVAGLLNKFRKNKM